MPRPATHRWLALLALLLATPAAAEFAPDGVMLGLTRADNFGDTTSVADTRAVRLGVTGPLPLPFLPTRWGNWRLETGYQLEVGWWRWDEAGDTEATSLNELGITPVLRALPADGDGLYLEVASGLRLLSRSKVSGRELSTEFHFGSHGGVGMRFGPGERLDAALLLQHLSNARIRTPNPGINFYQLRLTYRPAGW
jgi:hypothetical protein